MAIDTLYEYPELWQLAAWRLQKERSGHTLQATELVHDVYLEFLGLAKVDGPQQVLLHQRRRALCATL